MLSNFIFDIACALYYKSHMTLMQRVLTFRPDLDILDAMTTLRDQDGVPFSQQIRRALRLWLETKGALQKASRINRGARQRQRAKSKR